MKRKAYQVASSATRVVVMAAFLSTLFFANASPSFAGTDKEKSATIVRPSAVEHTEARIKELRGVLKTTQTQGELWNNVTEVMRENAKDMDALTKDKAKAANMNAVERMKLHTQITEAHLAQLKKFVPPFEALYASMSDEQKKSTDTIFQTGRHGKHKTK